MAYAIHPEARIGHVHLKVADLDRSIAFYKDVLGFRVMQKADDKAAWLSAGGYHHHIALNTWQSAGGKPPPKGHTGLFHLAIVYPDRASLAKAVANVVKAGTPIDGASDHGVSEAVYFDDPDGNGIELYRDRQPSDWPRNDAGGLAMSRRPLDLDQLLADVAGDP